jgi:predicted porin
MFNDPFKLKGELIKLIRRYNMNKKIAAAVSSAALVLGSTAANAGIVIPAGEWTLDVNGNVNVYATFQDFDDASGTTVTGGVAGTEDAAGESSNQSINTGLLPAWLGFTGTTRQNDLDVSFTISMQPSVSGNVTTGDQSTTLWRQAFLTFGDKSWGSIKMGKDLGIFAGQAILNDMTLLGVGAAYGNSGTATTLGGIGTGYIYPAWKGQIAYTTPNFNGFTATIAVTNPNQVSGNGATSSTGDAGLTAYQDRFGIEGEIQFAFDSGKVWASGATYTVEDQGLEYDAEAVDIGANLNFGNIGLTAYYYTGEGAGTTTFGFLGANASGQTRDSDGGYVQATYVIPSGTKLGVAYGVSQLDALTGDAATLLDENKRWTVGAYHPLTKHLNLVAEYNAVESTAQGSNENESSALSLGAILFF